MERALVNAEQIFRVRVSGLTVGRLFVWWFCGNPSHVDRCLPNADRKAPPMRKRKLTFTGTGAAAAFGAIAALLGSSASLGAGDAAAGKQAFSTTCGACHSPEP